MCEIQGLSNDPYVAYQQGWRDGQVETLHAAKLAVTSTNSAMVPCQHKFFPATGFGFVECRYCGATYPIEAQHQ